jgi:hypothetical protein
LLTVIAIIGLVLAVFAAGGIGAMFGIRLIRFGLVAIKHLGSVTR